jgi:hypothetical protein
LSATVLEAEMAIGFQLFTCAAPAALRALALWALLTRFAPRVVAARHTCPRRVRNAHALPSAPALTHACARR